MMRNELREVAVEAFSIHPVPNNGVFHLLGALEQGMRVQIIDFNGKQVFSKTIETATNDELIETRLQSGTYTLVVTDSAEQELFRAKTVIIH